MQTSRFATDEHVHQHPHDHDHHDGADCQSCGHDHEHTQIKLGQTLVGLIFIINSFIVDWFFTSGRVVSELSAMIGAIILGYPIVWTSIKDLRRGILSINELVGLAVLAAFAGGAFGATGEAGGYQTAGIVAFFMLLGEIIETRTAAGARQSIESLIRLTPTKARRLKDGSETEVAVHELAVGDVIRVRPGDNVAADGQILSGEGSINQANITGESLPIDKKPGDSVFAGTINLTGVLEIKVTRAGRDTTLGKVRDLILAAEKTKLPMQKIVDQYMGFYTPLVLVIGALVWTFTQDLSRVIAVLVVACPCAFILATPTAMVAALSAAARLGILIKNVADIELAAKINAFVFDKTGTLTTGKLAVSRLAPAAGVTPSDLLKTAASAEKYSNHPTAKALAELAAEAGVQLPEPKNFAETAGRGVKANVDGTVVLVGRSAWLTDNGVTGEFLKSVDINETEGFSLLFVARNGQCIGWVGLQDETRHEAKDSLVELKAVGVRRIAMVSGDRQPVAARVARDIGCEEVLAECLPQNKVEFVKATRARGYKVAVVGDGVNDAPALAAGDLGIAMGAAGSEVAIHSATIALMNNDLRRLPFLVKLSRMTRSVINQNFLFGIFFIIGGLTAAAFGYLSPIIAAIMHNAGSLIVVFNSARLVRQGEELEPFQHAPAPEPPGADAGKHAAAGQLQPKMA
ncbi:MAG: cation-translocating P-type ATPase [Verrucomicrobia bacterium]|nr:cation-translocating P-type ATPase [Verrucomicrobiota bacterium]